MALLGVLKVCVCCAVAEYNSLRLVYTLVLSLFFGTAFWQMGQRKETRNDVLTIMGSLFVASM